MENQKRAPINYEEHELIKLASARSIFEQARIIKQAVDRAHPEDLSIHAAASKYYRILPTQFRMRVSDGQRAEFEEALLSHTWRAYSKGEGWVLNIDIPERARALIDRAVDFEMFEDFFIASQQGICPVDVDQEMGDTGKSWLEHIAKHASLIGLFERTGKRTAREVELLKRIKDDEQ